MIKIPGLFTIELKQILFPILFIAIGILVYEFLKKTIIKISNRNTKNLKQHQLHRIKTVNMLVAGLGVTTAIIGLAFQDLAKDLIAGIFIITEAQYEVGDTIQVDGFMGEVVSIGLKTTQIRDYKGATKIIGNRYMDNMINYSLHTSLAVVDVGVDYGHTPKAVEETLQELAQELNGTMENAKGDIQILGINELDDSSIVYRVTLEVKSMKQFETERFLRKKIIEKFEQKNIKIPVTQIEVHNGK